MKSTPHINDYTVLKCNQFLHDLRERLFEGDTCQDVGTRTVTATDNSIYQVLPQAILYPKNAQDVALILFLAGSYPDLHFTARSEHIAFNQAKNPRLWNAAYKIAKPFIRALGLVDIPPLSTTSLKHTFTREIKTLKQLNALTIQNSLDHVIVLQDMLTTFYDTSLLFALRDLLKKLNISMHILPFRHNGKTLLVKGYVKEFIQLASQHIDELKKIHRLGIPIIGIDPSITLSYRDEYPRYTKKTVPPILLLGEWLSKILTHRPKQKNPQKDYYLFPHCHERSIAEKSLNDWKLIFNHFNMRITLLKVGCCGMAGSYGYEKIHKATSEKLFDLNCRKSVEKYGTTLLATSFSCRCQIKRATQRDIKHPINIIESLIDSKNETT